MFLTFFVTEVQSFSKQTGVHTYSKRDILRNKFFSLERKAYF